jgi:Fic family protein
VIGTDCTVLNNPKFNIKSPTKTIENLPLQYKSIFESGSTDLEKAVIFHFAWRGVLNTLQHYVIKFVNDLRRVCGFFRILQFPPQIKLTHDLSEIILKVALSNKPKPNPAEKQKIPLFL